MGVISLAGITRFRDQADRPVVRAHTVREKYIHEEGHVAQRRHRLPDMGDLREGKKNSQLVSFLLTDRNNLRRNELSAIRHEAQGLTMSPQQLTDARNKLGLNQGQLARKLGVTIRTVNKWERSSRLCVPTIMALAMQSLMKESK